MGPVEITWKIFGSTITTESDSLGVDIIYKSLATEYSDDINLDSKIIEKINLCLNSNMPHDRHKKHTLDLKKKFSYIIVYTYNSKIDITHDNFFDNKPTCKIKSTTLNYNNITNDYISTKISDDNYKITCVDIYTATLELDDYLFEIGSDLENFDAINSEFAIMYPRNIEPYFRLMTTDKRSIKRKELFEKFYGPNIFNKHKIEDCYFWENETTVFVISPEEKKDLFSFLNVEPELISENKGFVFRKYCNITDEAQTMLYLKFN